MALKRGKAKGGSSKSVTHGRPPLSKSRNVSLSAKATRTLIRSHHDLRKAQASALAAGDSEKAASLEARINASGGIESYQLASTLGQSSERGGDSSRILVEWLKFLFDEAQSNGRRLRMLEIGALSTHNACSKVPCLDIDRIDLHSQAPGIREIDFMKLPTPKASEQKYHILSLSLVLNFVPDASGRGDMLKSIPLFLREASQGAIASYLFLVLPLSCITNSRYLTEVKLQSILQSLGMLPDHVKQTSKLYYSLWKYDDAFSRPQSFRKEEIHPGKGRNNFAIVLK